MMYKVTQEGPRGQHMSVIEGMGDDSLPTTPGLGVQYSLNKWTNPVHPECWLMCFKDIQAAEGFALGMSCGKTLISVWECEAPGAVPISHGANLDHYATNYHEAMKEFWTYFHEFGDPSADRKKVPVWSKDASMFLPSGTHAAPRIKLVKKISSFQFHKGVKQNAQTS